ncbi:hypothetical protein MYP_67 [Sporocytophaga myxococcoides]|uniref:DUF6089 domain-containing protein n=1 Tax=Sporocytophaga myxococcoides TaxID=153721 RepID=A0A098L893_9BACT|nr:hypothetical protein MYP_67 [Sporocytophaga myxococcoides]
MFFIAIQSVRAQPYNYRCKYHSIVIGGAGSYANGDIKSTLSTIRPGLSFGFNKRIYPRLSYEFDFLWFRLLGDDFLASDKKLESADYLRNLHFRNDIKELSFTLRYDLLPNTDHYRKRPIYNAYVLLGGGVFYHNPKAKNDRDHWVSLRKLQTEGKSYSNIQFSVPAGFGFRYKLAIQWDLELEFTYRYTSTDYLDDVSRNYINPDQLKSDQSRQMSNRSASLFGSYNGAKRDIDFINNTLEEQFFYSGSGYSYSTSKAPGSKRGSKIGPDSYVLVSLRLIYIIPGKIYCPKFR